MTKIKNKALVVLCIALVVVLLGSIFAQMFNTSMYSVKVSRISFETEHGVLSGLLYMPKGASAADPRPTLVTTHGYLNSAEMQDANAIEMSRRGYVVLALDMYDHGHSKGNADNTGAFFSFWPNAQYDAASYMYEQPYVMKDENGNGIIGVTGHSMGGFSSEMAVFIDEQTAAVTGVRKIYAILSEGADYQWSAYMGLDTQMAADTAGGRWYGKVAAQYDEFFFNNSEANQPGTVVHKDYVNTNEGRIFLEQVDGTAMSETWYNTSDGGHRIVYQPAETHPWNHFSKTTTGYLLSFYDAAFAGKSASIKAIAPNNQIWMLKEAFECVALIGFLVALMALAALLLKAPFFSKAKTGEAVVTKAASTIAEKVGSTSLFIATMLIPAIIFPTMYSLGVGSETMAWLKYLADIAIVCAVVALVIACTSKDGDKKAFTVGSVVVLVAAIVLRLLATKSFLNTFFGKGQVFKAGVPTSIMKWALVCAMISVLVMVCGYLFSKNRGSMEKYGIKANGMAVIASLCLAVVVAVAAYACLFLVDAIFKTDFRIWTFAFKTFEGSILSASLIYIPFFFIYYFVSGVGAINNTSSEKLQGVWGYVVASLTNMGGILLWLILQYGMLFAKGQAFYPGEALSGILLIALVPTLVVSSCYTKFLYKKTGNIYAAAFLNAILLTIMTMANTTVYFQM